MKEKSALNDKKYSQYEVEKNVAKIKSIKSTTEFLLNTSIHNRPKKIIDAEKTENGMIFTVNTIARENYLRYTHETSLYFYKQTDANIEKIYIHIELWSKNTFRVKVSDEKNPEDRFDRIPEDGKMLIGKAEKIDFSINEKDEYYQLVTEDITVNINKETSRISAVFNDGGEYFSQKKSEFKAADINDLSVSTLGNEKATFEALTLDNDEVIYGLGERFDAITRNGRTTDFYNKDAVGTTSKRSYINIPFYISTKGYGLFLNSGAATNWDVGASDMGAVQFSVLDSQIDYFVIAGKNPKEIMKGYSNLTGYTKLPPLWSFGLWMSRNSYTSWEVVDDIVKKVRDNDIPCDVVHLDTAWFKTDWNCDLKFSEERFPNPQEHIEKLKEKGFHTSLWQYNFIPPNDDNTHYLEAVENGYLAKDEKGNPYQLPDSWQGDGTKDVIVDFTNPKTRRWYSQKIYNLIKMGAGAIKTDFGEGIPTDAKFENVDGKYYHNVYTLLYNATVFNASKKASGENIVWARSGTAGSQRYPLHWGGDSQCTFDALAGTLRGALSIGMSGIAYFSHDIGGFIGVPDDELYVRWAQLGLFSSHSRCHGVGDTTHREPWSFSKQACDIFRKYDKLRYSLMPYIYSQAEKSTKTGLPMMRALYLEYPDDRNVYYIDDEYLFGDNLLIAPVLKPLSATNIRNVYLPKGIWYDYFTKEKITSPGMWIQRKVDLETLPIYVKSGTVLEYSDADTTLINGYNIIKTEKWD